MVLPEPPATSASTPEPAAPPETPLAYRVVRGGLWVALSSYLNVGFGFLANLILTRILAPEDFGVYALATFFFGLLNLRPRLGMGHAFAQRSETTGELVGTHFVLDVGSGLATLLLAAIALPVFRALGYSSDLAWVVLALAVVGIVDSVMGTFWVLLDRGLHFDRTSLVSGLAFPVSYLPALWLASHGGRHWSLVAQNGVYALLALMGVWWMARRRLPHVWLLRWRFDRRIAVQLIRFGLMVGLAGLAGMFVTQFDDFLVGTYVSLSTLGFYERAYRIANWPALLVSSVVTRAVFFTYTRLQEDRVRLEKTVTMTFWLITTLAFPLATALFALAPEALALLYGERWLPSVLFLRFLVLYSVIRPILDNAGVLFMAVGRPRWATSAVVAESLLLVAGGIPLTLYAGAVGTCIAVGICFAGGLVLRISYVRHIIYLPLWDTLVSPSIASMFSIGVYFLFSQYIHLGSLMHLSASFTLILIGFLFALFLLQFRSIGYRVRYIWQLTRLSLREGKVD